MNHDLSILCSCPQLPGWWSASTQQEFNVCLWLKGKNEKQKMPYQLLTPVHFQMPWSKFNMLSSVQLLSRVRLFATPWVAARQASLSITNSQSSRKLTSIEWVIPSSHLLLCRPHLTPPSIFASIRVFSSVSGGQSIGVSASASVLPMNTQDWAPSEWTGWISLQSKGLSRVFSKTTVQKHRFFGTQLSSQSNSHIHTWLLEKP